MLLKEEMSSFQPGSSKVRYRWGGARADVYLNYFAERGRPGIHYVNSVHTDVHCRRQGHARRLLQIICAEADEAGEILTLVCAPDDSASYHDIEAFYVSLGFVQNERLSVEVTSFPGYMIRTPKEGKDHA